MRNRRKHLIGIGALGAVLAACYAGVNVWRARQAAAAAMAEVDASREIRFRASAIDLHAPEGFGAFPAPAAFTDVRVFGGSIWLCGPAGLFEYDANGLPQRSYRVGMELPSAELARMAVAVAGDGRTQELWISTRGEGLLAFDGKGFRQVRPEQPEHRKAMAILPQSNGRLLFGTEKDGLLVYDGKRIVPLHPSLARLNVAALAGDETNLWIGTLDKGAAHFRAGELTWIGGLPDARVLAIETTDGGNRAFAGTPLGVAEIENGKVVREHGRGLFVQALAVREGSLIAGTFEDGLLELPLTVRPGRARPHRANTGGTEIRRILLEGNRALVLTDSGLTVDGKPFIRNQDALLADRNIAALAPDDSGRLWIGYFDHGLEILNGEESRLRAESDVLFCVNRIVHDPDRRRTLVGTANGLAVLDPAGSVRQVLRKKDGLIASHVTDLLVDDSGELTVATSAGVTFWRGDTAAASSLYAFHGLVNNHVYSLGRCGNRTLVGTLGGLSVLEGGLIRASYTTANSSLGHNWISGVVSVGPECFVGTYGAGVFGVDPAGTWRSFPDLRSGFEVNPNAMAVTDRAVYAGTLGQGLAVFDRRSSRWRWQTAGLPSLNVTAVAARGGSVYIGTENGLVKATESVLAP